MVLSVINRRETLIIPKHDGSCIHVNNGNVQLPVFKYQYKPG